MIPSDPALRVMLDSNAVDVIATTAGAFDALSDAVEAGDLDVLWTHITVDQLAAIPDGEKRATLLCLGVGLARMVATSSAIVGVSRLSFCRISPDNDANGFEAYRRGRMAETADALIATTAEFEHAALSTRDRGMIREAGKRGLRVIDPAELVDAFNQAVTEREAVSQATV